MKQLSLFLFPLAILAIVIIVAIYMSKRVAWAFSLNTKIVTIVTLALVVFFITTIIVVMQTNLTSAMSHFLNNISTIGIGVFALLAFSVIAIDLVQFVIKMPPKTFGCVVLGIAAILSVYALWHAQNTKTYYQDLTLPNMVQPVKLAHLSDIHIGHFWGERTIDRLVRMVEKENVDAVVITGDLFDGRVRLNDAVLQPFKRLKVPVFFVEGNHDGYSGSADIKNLLSKNGIIVLNNKMVEVKGLQIIGLDYLLADLESVNTFHAPPAGTTIKEVLPTFKKDSNKALLMLHHNPVGVEYAAANGVNLYLAGHTHAGQMFPATIVAKMMFPYNKGLYQFNDKTQVYVSQGSGTFGPPMRLCTDSEITIFNLK